MGAPWTLLIYMLGAKESKKDINYKKIKDKELEVNLILEKLHEYICLHIKNQINAGADVVQVFDSGQVSYLQVICLIIVIYQT